MIRDVLVIGDAILDRYWDGGVDRVSPEAPVPVLQVRSEYVRAGGAANVAVNLASLGSKPSLVTLVGDDDAGQRLAQVLQEHGVRLHASGGSRHRTTQKIRCVSRYHQLLRADFEEPAADDSVLALMAACTRLIPRRSVVILSDYGKGCLRYCAELIELANTRESLVLVDPKGTDFGRYRGAWLLKPNLDEMRAVVGAWTDEAELHRKAEKLRRSLDLDHLLLTRGEHGMTLFSQGGSMHLPAVVDDAHDVCGAGDTVLATVAHLTAHGAPIDEAVRFANRAAGLVVRKHGVATATASELGWGPTETAPYAEAQPAVAAPPRARLQ